MVISLCFLPALAQLAEFPSEELLRYMAAIGATLLIAYAVETASVARSPFIRSETRENWIGAIIGGGSCGFLGIVVALALAERAKVDHWTWIDEVAFSFAAGSLLLLGAFVVALPYLAYEWSRDDDSSSAQDPD